MCHRVSKGLMSSPKSHALCILQSPIHSFFYSKRTRALTLQKFFQADLSVIDPLSKGVSLTSINDHPISYVLSSPSLPDSCSAVQVAVSLGLWVRLILHSLCEGEMLSVCIIHVGTRFSIQLSGSIFPAAFVVRWKNAFPQKPFGRPWAHGSPFCACGSSLLDQPPAASRAHGQSPEPCEAGAM